MTTWNEIRGDERYRNRWLALDHCRYEDEGSEPVEAEVIDSDEDLSELCTRLSGSNQRRCAIVFCETTPEELAPNPAPTSLSERRRFLRAS